MAEHVVACTSSVRRIHAPTDARSCQQLRVSARARACIVGGRLHALEFMRSCTVAHASIVHVREAARAGECHGRGHPRSAVRADGSAFVPRGLFARSRMFARASDDGVSDAYDGAAGDGELRLHT
jgi:hypothetical protein